jgi:hypothetical protein
VAVAEAIAEQVPTPLATTAATAEMVEAAEVLQTIQEQAALVALA